MAAVTMVYKGAPDLRSDEPVAAAPSSDPVTDVVKPLPEKSPVKAASPRLAALDAFRGLTVLLMLLVNNVALDTATPHNLQHAEWSGDVNLADVVFPWFLLAVGVAIPFAVASSRRVNAGWLGYYGKALRRTAALVALGWLVDSTVNHTLLFDLGVLQIIGLAYFVAAILSPLRGRWRLLIAGALLAAHSAVLLYWKVPGFGSGHITANANAVAFLNEIYLAPWGLKGILSVLPTAAMVLIGTVIGDLFRKQDVTLPRRAATITLAGVGLIAAGLIFSHSLPMNKPLWTAPYILYTAGCGAILLALLHLVVDGTKQGSKLALPMTIAGCNAITAYVVPILIKVDILQAWIVPNAAILGSPTTRPTMENVMQSWCYTELGRIHGGWLYTCGYIFVWWLVLFLLYRKQWFLRV